VAFIFAIISMIRGVMQNGSQSLNRSISVNATRINSVEIYAEIFDIFVGNPPTLKIEIRQYWV
jgi:hypothetical protein